MHDVEHVTAIAVVGGWVAAWVVGEWGRAVGRRVEQCEACSEPARTFSLMEYCTAPIEMAACTTRKGDPIAPYLPMTPCPPVASHAPMHALIWHSAP